MQIAVVRFRFLSALASSGLQSSMKRTRSRISGIPRNGSGNEARVGPPTQGPGRSTSATSPDAWKTGSPERIFGSQPMGRSSMYRIVRL